MPGSLYNEPVIHYALKRYWRVGVLAVAAAAFLLVLATGIWGYRVGTVKQSATLTVDNGGILSLGGRSLGRFHLNEAGGYELRLPVASDEALGCSSLELELALPADLSSQAVGVQFASIQGTAFMEVSRPSSSRLHLSLPCVLSDSHTVITLTVPRDAFSVSWLRQATFWVLTIPSLIWAGAAAVFLAIVALYAFVVTRPIRVPPVQGLGEPPYGLTPIEMAIMLNGSIKPRDLLASLYELARRGHLLMINQGEDTLFYRATSDDELRFYEEMLLNFVCPKDRTNSRLSEIVRDLRRELFSSVVSNIYIETYNSLTAREWFRENLRYLRIRRKTAAILVQAVAVLLVVLSYFLPSDQALGWYGVGVAFYAAGILLYWAAGRLPNLTEEGQEAYRSCVAFANFLVDRKPLPIVPGGDELLYRYFGYAISLDGGQWWLNRFARYTMAVPQWLSSTEAFLNTPAAFLNLMDSILAGLSSAFEQVKDPNVD